MSRRHHGRPHHGRNRGSGQRPAPAVEPRPITATDAPGVPIPPRPSERPPSNAVPPSAAEPSATPATGAERAPTQQPATPPLPVGDGVAQQRPSVPPLGAQHGNGNGVGERPNGCTAPQLRRFIKSRPYVPMHELRRRFAINGDDDDVTQVLVEGSRIYVGLPDREGNLLGELLRGGEIGYELSLDPLTPVVVGVYPMRPVPRP